MKHAGASLGGPKSSAGGGGSQAKKDQGLKQAKRSSVALHTNQSFSFSIASHGSQKHQTRKINDTAAFQRSSGH